VALHICNDPSLPKVLYPVTRRDGVQCLASMWYSQSSWLGSPLPFYRPSTSTRGSGISMSAANYTWGKLNELPAVEQMHSFEQCSPLQSIMTLKPYSGQRPLKVIGNDTVIYRPDMTKTVYSNFGTTLHRFWDTAWYSCKFATITKFLFRRDALWSMLEVQ